MKTGETFWNYIHKSVSNDGKPLIGIQLSGSTFYDYSEYVLISRL